MSWAVGRLARPLLLRLDPEAAHRAAVAMMRFAPKPVRSADDPMLAVEAFGLRFPNPVGLAAGFDKDATLGEAALAYGFGFTEAGTLTPLPQAGNPRPRVFRLSADRAVINRYGFNNGGHAAAAARLERRRGRGVLGVNIGANKDSTDRAGDYVAGVHAFAPLADYLTVNVSSPNTPGLRSLQDSDALDDLLARVLEARDAAAEVHGRRPVLLKIAPDLDAAQLDDIVAVARHRRIDGLIVSNTTLARPASLSAPEAHEAGGLSGRPLFAPATRMLAQAFLRIEGQFPLIGAGGIDNPATALAKIRAGATLVQLYSGLIYGGLGLIAEIKHELSRSVSVAGSLQALVGADSSEWAQRSVA